MRGRGDERERLGRGRADPGAGAKRCPCRPQQADGYRRTARRAGGGRPVRRSVDLMAAERAAGDLLQALGANLDGESLERTPARMAAAYAELLTPEPFDLTTFPNDGGYDELVV